MPGISTYFLLFALCAFQKASFACFACCPSSSIDTLPSAIGDQNQSDPVANFSGNEIIIPIKRVGRLLIIEAQVDSLRGNFIFDTGASGLVLNQTYFRNYRTVSGYYASGAGGRIGGLAVAEVEQLTFNGISYSRVEAGVSDLSDIENVRDIQILGLLGLNLFKSFEVEIDLKENSLRLARCNRNGEPMVPSATKYSHVIPLEIFENTVFMKLTIAKRSLKYAIDTGAEINILRINAPKPIIETVQITGRSVLKGAGNQTVEIITGRMGDCTIGSLPLLGMQTILTQLDGLNDAYGTPIDGILGFDFFVRGSVKINCSKKELAFELFDNFR